MNRSSSSQSSAEWPLLPTLRTDSIESTTSGPERESILYSPYASTTFTPIGSPRGSESLFTNASSESNPRLQLTSTVLISFVRGSRLFKMRFSNIEICKDSSGDLKAIELADNSGLLQSSLIHTFPTSRRPIPHLERPTAASDKADLRVSFLDEQTVQTAKTIFAAQPHYSFEMEEDCIRFQEALLNYRILFTAGIAEAKSKGRGEECISQNLRLVQSRSGTQYIIFFANSQRKEKKRYVSIPLNCIDHIEPAKRAGRPITLRLGANNDLLTQMKQISFLFLDDTDQRTFHGLLSKSVGGSTP